MTVVLEAHDIEVSAVRDGRWRAVVEDVQMAVRAGELCGIVGETGAGKTLATRAILGLLPRGTRARGDVRVDGDHFGAGSEEARARLGDRTAVVLQNPATSLNPLDRVGRQLTEGVVHRKLMSRPAARRRALELLERLGFEAADDVVRLYPHQLSGGMAQRVMIAAALMSRPRLLVVDEPTSALDANVRVAVLELIREMAGEEQAGVLLVSHDLALVGRFCDRIIVMYGGRVVEAGALADVLTAPRHPYTAALLGCSITPDVAPHTPLRVIDGRPPAPEEWPVGCVFEPRCPLAFDRCARERPWLGAGEHAAACHLAPGHETRREAAG
jgi:oligopeptide/dipeptide ABC transporter ATP-binding protein